MSNPVPAMGSPSADSVLAAVARSKELRKSGDLKRALATLEPLVRGLPDRADVWHAIGGVYLDLRMRERGTSALARAVQLAPESARPAKLLAKQIVKRQAIRRDSIGEVMMFVRDAGFSPETIIDVGVNTGTPGLYEFFPDAHFLMVEPLEESVPFMEHLTRLYPNAAYECCGAASRDGEMTLSVAPAFGGSRFAETVGGSANGETRTVPVRRLDGLVRERELPGPYVLKVDTEGAELEVLGGAMGILEETELMILESRVRPVGTAPDLLAMLDVLRAMGFVPYDFIDRNYHDGDGTLKQFDLVVVKLDGFFRTPTEYARLATSESMPRRDVVKAKLRKRQAQAERLGSS